MTEHDAAGRAAGTPDPATPDAEIHTAQQGEEGHGDGAGAAARSTGTSSDSAGSSGADEPEATSPRLEHLQETIKDAQRAADQALSPDHE
jgi:hypothetical protein